MFNRDVGERRKEKGERRKKMAAIGKVILGFELIDRVIGDDDVIGLKDLIVVPRAKSIGRKTLQLIEALAEDKIVVAFVEDTGLKRFFEHCGWFIGNEFSGKTLIASEPVDDSKHGGEVW